MLFECISGRCPPFRTSSPNPWTIKGKRVFRNQSQPGELDEFPLLQVGTALARVTSLYANSTSKKTITFPPTLAGNVFALCDPLSRIYLPIEMRSPTLSLVV